MNATRLRLLLLLTCALALMTVGWPAVVHAGDALSGSVGGLSSGAMGFLLSLGALASLLLRRGLTDGTWPRNVQLADPYKSVLAAALGALPPVFTAKAAGADWSTAFAVGSSGLVAVVQGILEKTNPKKAEAETATETKG